MEPKNAAIGRGPVTKTLLIVSGGAQAAAAAAFARALGHTVVVSDSDPQAPAFAFADSCLIADANGEARNNSSEQLCESGLLHLSALEAAGHYVPTAIHNSSFGSVSSSLSRS